MVPLVQKKMVGGVSGLQGRTCKERLEELGMGELGMETLEKRRQYLDLDLDLVTTFKILKGIDDVDKVTWFRQVPADRTHRTRATKSLLERLQKLNFEEAFLASELPRSGMSCYFMWKMLHQSRLAKK